MKILQFIYTIKDRFYNLRQKKYKNRIHVDVSDVRVSITGDKGNKTHQNYRTPGTYINPKLLFFFFFFNNLLSPPIFAFGDFRLSPFHHFLSLKNFPGKINQTNGLFACQLGSTRCFHHRFRQIRKLDRGLFATVFAFSHLSFSLFLFLSFEVNHLSDQTVVRGR